MRKKTVIFYLVGFLGVLILLSGCGATPENPQQSATNEKAVGSEQQDAVMEEKSTPPVADTEVIQEKTTPEEKPPQQADSEQAVVVVPDTSDKAQELTLEPIPEEKVEITTDSDPVAEDKKTTDEVPVSRGANHFVITAQPKDAAHPFFGKGHPYGFSVNNVPGKEVVLERGKAYDIDVFSDPKHDVYISTKEIGWGSTPWVEGVEGMYTYKGTIKFTPPSNTPDKLYYSCRNHPYMGGTMHIVNPGQSVALKQSSSLPAKSTKSADKSAAQVTAAAVKQKLMYAEMLIQSKSRQGGDGNKQAQVLQNDAKKHLEQAKKKLDAGANAEALALAEKAVASVKQSSKLVPNKSQIQLMKSRYKELLTSVLDFEASHKDNYDRIIKKGKGNAVDYDKKEVKRLKESAAQSAEKGDYAKANKNLEQAQHMVTLAVHQMLNDQTIVYDLNFESAEEEYEYEAKRFTGYEELIPVAIEAKKPAPGSIKLMESFLKKGRDLRDRAVKKAKDGEFPTAIAMMQDATKSVRRALRMVGVMQ